jgi:hypothetical protein
MRRRLDRAARRVTLAVRYVVCLESRAHALDHKEGIAGRLLIEAGGVAGVERLLTHHFRQRRRLGGIERSQCDGREEPFAYERML